MANVDANFVPYLKSVFFKIDFWSCEIFIFRHVQACFVVSYYYELFFMETTSHLSVSTLTGCMEIIFYANPEIGHSD